MLSQSQITEICQNYGFSENDFRDTFDHMAPLDGGVFHVRMGKKLEFLHAGRTTGDSVTNIVSGKSGNIQELWLQSTGIPIGEFGCVVANCTTSEAGLTMPGRFPQAEVAAQVYSTTQDSSKYKEHMILIPTCRAWNDRRGNEKYETRYPTPMYIGREVGPGDTVPLIFIKASLNTEGGKGDAGKGADKGGNLNNIAAQQL